MESTIQVEWEVVAERWIWAFDRDGAACGWESLWRAARSRAPKVSRQPPASAAEEAALPELVREKAPRLRSASEHKQVRPGRTGGSLEQSIPFSEVAWAVAQADPRD